MLKHETNKLGSKETNTNLFWKETNKLRWSIITLSLINYVQTNKFMLHGLSMLIIASFFLLQLVLKKNSCFN